MTDKNHVGCPSEMTEAMRDEILCRIAEGRSISDVDRDPAMPSYRTLYRFIANDDDFQEKYQFASEVRAQRMFDEIKEIADAAKTAEEAQIAKVRIDARKWKLAK